MSATDSTAFQSKIRSLLELGRETEWLEFKQNDERPEEIGEYLSALANSAALLGQSSAFLVWGIKDGTLDVVGTSFRPHRAKVGNQELRCWLELLLTPHTDFQITEGFVDALPVVLFEIQPARSQPVRWKDTAFIRVGSYKKKLRDFPEKERALWTATSGTCFEEGIAKAELSGDEVLQLLDYPGFFDLSRQPLPANRQAILDRLVSERLVVCDGADVFGITKLGGLLFARRLTDFDRLGRKAARVIEYDGVNRVRRIREHQETKGYAVGFRDLLAYLNPRLPKNEILGQALRREVPMYPELAVREVIANALIHQDFHPRGEGPLIELFSDRIEVTNPGEPLVDPLRFLDAPPRSRNEDIASMLRRLGLCEEVGSGIDKVVFEIEVYQLPAPDFRVVDGHTRTTMFAHKMLSDMNAEERIRACYLHSCLEYVSGRQMTNTSLRKRLSIADSNYPIASRIIAEAIRNERVKPADPTNKSRKHAKYLPFWA